MPLSGIPTEICILRYKNKRTMWKLKFRYFCLSIDQIFLQSFLKLYLSLFADDRWLRRSRIFANGKGTKVESSYKVTRVFFLSSLAIINELILVCLDYFILQNPCRRHFDAIVRGAWPDG